MTLTPLLTAPPAIILHATCAILAMLIGAVVLFRRKGTPLHKALGRIWVVLMLIVATSALFINEIRMFGPFSPIHLLVLVTYAGIGNGLWQIRHRNVAGHRASMQATYIGALLLAGAFTLMPGRRMHDVLFGADSGWTPSLIAIPLALLATAWIWHRLMPRRGPRTVLR